MYTTFGCPTPKCSHSFETDLREFSSKSNKETVAPNFENNFAVAAPIPFPAPLNNNAHKLSFLFLSPTTYPLLNGKRTLCF